jgi:hypothetical protein
MNTLFATLLVVHVLTGLIGTIALYGFILGLLKKEFSPTYLLSVSFTAWVGYMLSWVSGGYYYWFYYGTQVKPLILEGNYVWAHKVVMEAKEHVFLLIPILSFTLILIVLSGRERLVSDSRYRSGTLFLAAVTCSLATLITISGIIISGAAR